MSLVTVNDCLGLHRDELQERDAVHRHDLGSTATQFRSSGGVGSEFTQKYGLHRLVYVEAHPTMPLAIARKKRLKAWNRAWKVRLINRDNPEWEDLFDRMLT